MSGIDILYESGSYQLRVVLGEYHDLTRGKRVYQIYNTKHDVVNAEGSDFRGVKCLYEDFLKFEENGNRPDMSVVEDLMDAGRFH